MPWSSAICSARFPFGLVLTRLAGLGDVRSIGSGNIGATNVLRTGNRGLAAATLLLDILKGTFAALVASWLAGPEAAIIGGLFAFFGHLFPVWLKFKGGKGVATYLGIFLGVAPLLALAFALTWLATAAITRYSSLSALVASLVVPVAGWLLGMQSVALFAALMTVITWIKHRANIARLRHGSESRIGKR